MGRAWPSFPAQFSYPTRGAKADEFRIPRRVGDGRDIFYEGKELVALHSIGHGFGDIGTALSGADEFVDLNE
jgi:hypothetical protein